MDSFSIKVVGEKIQAAGKLKFKPLCIYGSERVPQEATKISTISRCLAKAIFTAANKEKPPTLYLGKEAIGGCCAGGSGWTGYTKMAPIFDYYISTGNKQFRAGEAEYLKACPELVAEFKKALGNITPMATYTVISAYDTIEENVDVRSFICFGNAEQIRNLCALIHFRTTNPFSSVSAAWGPSCATIMTYPAGIAEKAPKDTAFLGPLDPTGNCWFPQDFMSLGIPLKVAIAMSEDLEHSFIIKRPQVAYPSLHETAK